MTPDVLTAAQMRTLEQAAIDTGAVTGLDLMERAGRGVVDAILAEWPDLAKSSARAVVLCGPGNNGGDGFVVARLLKDRGWEVEVFLYGNVGALPPDARAKHDRWAAMGAVRPLVAGALAAAVNRAEAHSQDGPDGRSRSGCPGTIYVDALFGIGLSRPLAADLDEIARTEWGDRCRAAGVAVDMPSGICADSGRRLGGAGFRARVTVTFHRPKRGHYLGHDISPSLACVDIGLRGRAVPGDAVTLTDVGRSGVGPRALDKLANDQKYNHGHAWVIAGGVGRGGAARLAARGALRIGAGLVTVGCPPAALVENAARLDAIMVRALKGANDASALAGVLGDDRINALCLGPGLGLDERAEALVACALDAAIPGVFRDGADYARGVRPHGAVEAPGERRSGAPDAPGRPGHDADDVVGVARQGADVPGATRDLAPQEPGATLNKADDGPSKSRDLDGTGATERRAQSAATPLSPVPGVTRDLDRLGHASPAPDAAAKGPGSGPGRGAAKGPGSGPGRGLVLDADALTILARHPCLRDALPARCVLTPHGGEFARLFPDIADRLTAPASVGPAYSKIDATRAAAARAGCVVLFKGPDTVIADPSGRCVINPALYDRAAPWLATAGSGDVLAGFITGLLARGFAPFDAAATAAWLHVECAHSFGPGLVAEDLAEELPQVFRALGI